MKQLRDSAGRKLPAAPYKQAEDMSSDIVKVDWMNWAIHVRNALSRGWRVFYYKNHRLAMVLPRASGPNKPYSIFHPEKPYEDESSQGNNDTA